MADYSVPADRIEITRMFQGDLNVTHLPPEAAAILESCRFPAAPVQVTATHLEVVRRARFVLDPTENTAPLLDPTRPFGSTNPLFDVATITGIDTWSKSAELYCGTLHAVIALFQHGRLEPGTYPIMNLPLRDFEKASRTPVDDGVAFLRKLGFDASLRFTYTEEHRALLGSAQWGMTYADPGLIPVEGTWSTVYVDSKRTYDVKRLVDNMGWKSDLDKYGFPVLDAVQANKLWSVHDTIWPAFQVFVENAELAPGTYELY